MAPDLATFFSLLAPREDWTITAETDPRIQAWFKQIKKDLKIPDSVDVVDFMVRDLSYDYRTAIGAGLRPSLQKEDGKYHWGSADPRTGNILKAPWHPTYHKEIEARKGQGVKR
jgi:hypothetical protein